MYYKLKIEADKSNIDKGIKFIESSLNKHNYAKKKILKALLASEEIITQLIENSENGSLVGINISARRNGANIEISSKGKKCELNSSVTISQVTDYDKSNEEEAFVISNLILKSFNHTVSLQYKNGVNKASIKLKTRESDSSLTTVSCLIFGFVIGLVFKVFVPVTVASFVHDNIISSISQIFMNAINLIVVPLVFFSIAEGVSGFSDIKVFGRIGAKIIFLYTLTTLIAIFVSMFFFKVISPGDVSLLPSVLKMINSNYEAQQIVLSFKDTITNIVPSNFFGAFIKGDMFQVIFVAVLLGYATSLMGEYGSPVLKFIKAGNELFSKITSLIISFLPLAIFSMSFKLVYCADVSTLHHIIALFGVMILCFITMYSIYFSIIFFIGRYNPFKFILKFKQAIITGFTTCSSGVTMPFTMKALDDVGVSPKIYSFSIPLGATVNMDGASINYVLNVLFVCKIFGIELTLPLLISLALPIVVISFGTPGVAGAGLAFFSLLLAQAGVPVGAVAFIAPITAMLEFFETVLNITGDAAVTLAVARTEGLLDDK